MNVALAKTDTGRALSDAFAAARDRLPGAGKVAERRQQAFDAYERAGLPHRRIEEWKYTDLRALMREVLPLAAAPDAAALKRAKAALKAHAIAGMRGWCWWTACSRPSFPSRPISKRALASARCARCWKAATPALAGATVRA